MEPICKSFNSIPLILARDYMTNLLTTGLSKEFCFHDLAHTQMVVNGSRQIASSFDLSSKQREILLLAAWFHDSGYVIDYHEHVKYSQKIAKSFLQKLSLSFESIQMVCDCIAATEMPQNPGNLLGEILCDADLFHLSLEHYPQRLQNLRQEWEALAQLRFSDEEWHQSNLSFLQNHQYFTKYGKEVLEPRKQNNIRAYSADKDSLEL